MEKDHAIFALAVAALVYTGWVFRHLAALAFLGIAAIKRKFVGAAVDVTVECARNEFAEIHGQLLVLGFAPLGIMTESMLGKTAREYMFTSSGIPCSASAYHIFERDPPRVALMTTFTNGAIAYTQNYEGGATKRSSADWMGPPEALVEAARDATTPAEESPTENVDDSYRAFRIAFLLAAGSLGLLVEYFDLSPIQLYVCIGIAVALVIVAFSIGSPKGAPAVSEELPPLVDSDKRFLPAAVFAEHERRVAEFVANGYAPKSMSTQADIIEAQQLFAECADEVNDGTMLQVFWIFLAVVLFVPALLAFKFGIEHLVPWAALLVCSGMLNHFLRFGRLSSRPSAPEKKRLFRQTRDIPKQGKGE